MYETTYQSESGMNKVASVRVRRDDAALARMKWHDGRETSVGGVPDQPVAGTSAFYLTRPIREMGRSCSQEIGSALPLTAI
jgi:hypothetical protein